jgi:PAS domain S-box-containing protein
VGRVARPTTDAGRLAELGRLRRQDAETIAELREQLRKEIGKRNEILDSVEDGFVALDCHWRYTYVNRRAGEMLGRDPAQLIGKHIWTEFPEGLGQLFQRAYERALAEQRTITLEEYYPPWDRWFENRIYPREGGLVIFFTEITARRRAEEELRRSRAELRALLENMVDGVFACDLDGRITFANDAAWRMIGFAERPAQAESLHERLNALNARRLDGAPVDGSWPLERALHGETVLDWVTLVQDRRTGMDHVHHTNATPLPDFEGAVRGAVMVVSDVTDERELERLQDQFLGVAAHELKTPVAIVKGCAELLAAADLPEDRKARARRSLERGAERIDRVVTDLLELSQLSLDRLRLHVQPLELATLVREEGERAARSHPEHRIQLRICEAAAQVNGDGQRLRQVLRALLSNAIKFSPEPAEVLVELRREGAHLLTSVQDRGIGIPVERQRRIFQRFFRAHTDTPFDTGGMGVGLHVARELIVRQGGSMGFESTPGIGSRFWFTLPLFQ